MGSPFTLAVGFAAMNAFIDSWSSASSVGDDDHPEIRISPDSAATVVPADALGDVAGGVLPHGPMTSASNVVTESNAFRFTLENLPVLSDGAPWPPSPAAESYSRGSEDRD